MGWKKRPLSVAVPPLQWGVLKKEARAKPRKLEEPIHILCLNWLLVNFDGMVFHVPNGLFAGNEVIFLRGKPVRRASVMWAKLEKMGARAGVLDLTLHWRGVDGIGRTAYLEIKSADGKYTDGQKDFMKDLDICGIPHRLCRSLEDCRRAFFELGLPSKNFSLSRSAPLVLS